MKPADLAAYVFLALTWGLSFLVLLNIVAAFGWVGAVAFRALIAAATLLAVARLTGRRLDFSAGWRPFAIVGATTVAGQLVCLSVATPIIGTAMAAILVAAIPLFSMLISQAWGLERMAWTGVIGLVLGAAGIVLLVGFPEVPVTARFLSGCAIALAGSLSAALGSNYVSLRLRRAGSLEVTIGSFLAGGLMTLPLLAAVPVPTTPAPLDYLQLAVAGCLMSALTYVVYFRLVGSIGATRAISVEFAVTVVAVIVGAAFLHERLSPVQVAGAVIIILGCMLVLGLIRLPRPVRH